MYVTDLPFREYSDLSGKPLDGGYIYFGQPNQNPETAPITAYWDAAGTQPALQPIRTTNGLIVHNGAMANLFVAGNYSITVRDRNNSLVFYAPTSDRIPFEASLATAGGAALIGWIQSGTGAVLRLAQDKLREVISAKDFGAVGDGTTSDYAAMVAAFAAAAGRKLFIPAGTYKLPFSATSAFAPSASCVIEGEGPGLTVLRLEPDSATYRNLFTLDNGGVTFRNLSVSVVAKSGQQLAFFNINSNGLTFDNCDFDGGMTNAGAVISHTAYGFSYPSTGTQTDLNVKSCTLHRFAYGVLKANAYTSVQRRISFWNCDLYGNYYEDLAFNSPKGLMDDVQISECRFRGGSGISASIAQYHCTFASVTEFSVTGNTFEDAVTEAIHIEENCQGGTVSGNTINVDGCGITTTDNNVGGTALMPQYISITGNTIRKAGTLGVVGSSGIRLTYDATTEVPLKNSVIADNAITGFEHGIESAVTLDDGCDVRGNVIDGCTYGIWAQYGSFIFRNNTTRGCTTGVYSDTAASFDQHTFVNCTTNADAVNRPIVLTDPVFLFPEFAVGASSTTYKNLVLLSVNDRMHGFLNLNVWSGPVIADRAPRRDEVLWDGATFTRTNKITEAPGAVLADSVRNANFLAVSVFSTPANSNMNVQAKLNGMVIVAV